MNSLTLYRKRFIPNETVHLKDDEILCKDAQKLITKWNVLKPRKDFHHGCSCYFLHDGIKVSKFLRSDGSLLYWYCDVVSYDYNQETGTLIVTDLLADVIVHPDGSVEVVDLDEVAEAFEKGLLTAAQMTACLRQLNQLLTYIYRDKFDRLQAHLEKLDMGL